MSATAETDLIELKGCPFCGGHAKLIIGEHNFNDAKVRCEDCSAEGPLFDDEERDDRSINSADAALHWNTRAAAH